MNYFLVFLDEDEPYFGLVTKEYWDAEQCLDDSGFDRHDLDLPRGFHETGESQYQYNGTFADAVTALRNAGFVEIYPNPLA